MSAPLLESLSGLVTPELIGKAAAAFGEQPAAVGRGIGATLPLLLGHLSHRAQEPGFASALFDLATDPANDGSLLRNLGSLLGPNAASLPIVALGGRLLASLFGGNTGAVAGALAEYAGVKSSSAGSLLSLGAPVVLSLLGANVKSGKLDAASLAGQLRNQRQLFAAELPASLQKFDGIPLAAAAGAPAADAAATRTGGWFLPALLLLGLVLLLPYCSNRQAAEPVATPPAEVAAPVEATPAPVETPAEAPATPLATLYFDVGKTGLPVDADATLAPIVSYVQSNPASMAVVSGFHDPTGDQAANHELAKHRAQAVKAALLAAGLGESQIELLKPVVTEGDGSLAEARRVEVSVR